MTFDFIRKQRRISYKIVPKDIMLLSGKFKGCNVSDIINSRYGVQYVQYLIREGWVGDDFIAVFTNMAIDPFLEAEINIRDTPIWGSDRFAGYPQGDTPKNDDLEW